MARRSWSLLLLPVLAGCTGHGMTTARPHPAAIGAVPMGAAPVGAAPMGAPAIAAPAVAPLPPDQVLLPLPGVTRPALIALTASGSLAGSVSLNAVTDPYFGDSAANFGLLGVAAGHALLTVTTLEGDLFTSSGSVVSGATASDGSFSLTGAVPADQPSVVVAHLAGDHQLSAIVPRGQASVGVDEASSMVTEMARWQLLPFADPHHAALTDLTASDVVTLHNETAVVLHGADLPEVAGAAPSVAALKTGAGHVLRNAYVGEFGARVSAPNTTSHPPEANLLSDKWEAVLGYKPLALTLVAGNGVHANSLEDGQDALQVGLMTPTDAVEDAQGNLFIAELDHAAIRFVPHATIAGPYLGAAGDQGTGQLTAGHLYTIAGTEKSTRVASAYRLLLEAGTTNPNLSHITFSAPLDSRVYMVACENTTRFGQPMVAGELYPIAGTGLNYNNVGNGVSGDNGSATSANLGFPTALARDASGNLFLLDTGPSGKGEIRVVRQSDGFIFTLPLTMNLNPFVLSAAGDMKLSPDGQWLYVAETDRHFVFKVAAPSPVAIAAWNASPTPTELTRVLGNSGRPGFLDTSVPNGLYPNVYQINAPITESVTTHDVTTIQVLLNGPSALEFTPGGDLLVADLNRLRLLRGTQVSTIAGGFASNFVTGDARLAYLRNTASLRWCSFDQNLLLTDRGLEQVRRLWTVRGVLHTGD